jgi:FG-GAP-like repeat/Abnormal spindle-like microcephaly-assoc'd, ASPM-SPD-2-Hydin/FG-GAP repeat
VDYAAGVGSASVAVGDFNRDGKLDLAVTSRDTNSVSILLGNGDGTFRSHSDYATDSFPVYVGVSDFNGDGNADLAVATFSTVSILLGTGNGTFQSHVDYPAYGSRAIAIGDFNGDGTPDLAAVSINGAGLFVLLGKTNGTFSPAVSYVIGPPANLSIVAVDLDGDGKLDLAATDFGPPYTGNKISVLRGNGDGTFAPEVEYDAGLSPAALAVGDINGDGHPDLVVGNEGTSSYVSDTVSVLLNKGNGTFEGHADFKVGPGPIEMLTADFDGDGKPDLVSLNQDNSVSVLLSNGDGTFQTQVRTSVLPYSIPFVIRAIAAGDFNGDGITDLVLSLDTGPPAGPPASRQVLLGDGHGGFQVLPPTPSFAFPAAFAVADFDGDGKLDLAYPEGCYVSVAFGNGNGTFQTPVRFDFPPCGGSSIVASDFNGDGKPDLAVGILINNTTTVLMNNGTGRFRALPAIQALTPLAAADLNGDGKTDLMTGGPGFFVLLGNGDGTFQSPAIYDVNGGASRAVITDLNQDGKLDLVLETGFGSAAFVPGNGDGTFEPFGALNVWDFLSGPGTASPVVADFNGDGAPDLAVTSLTSSVVSVFLSAPQAAFFPSNLKFGYHGVKSSSLPQTIALSNPGTAPLDISAIGVTGPFSQTSNCGTSLAVGASCTIAVNFAPAAVGAAAGMLSLTDNAPQGPPLVGLSGIGTLGQVVLFAGTIYVPSLVISPSLAFGNQARGTTSAPRVVTLLNASNHALSVTRTRTLPSTIYHATNACGAALAPGAACTFSVTFSPTTFGPRRGTLLIFETGRPRLKVGRLSGTGT